MRKTNFTKSFVITVKNKGFYLEKPVCKTRKTKSVLSLQRNITVKGGGDSSFSFSNDKQEQLLNDVQNKQKLFEQVVQEAYALKILPDSITQEDLQLFSSIAIKLVKEGKFDPKQPIQLQNLAWGELKKAMEPAWEAFFKSQQASQTGQLQPDANTGSPKKTLIKTPRFNSSTRPVPEDFETKIAEKKVPKALFLGAQQAFGSVDLATQTLQVFLGKLGYKNKVLDGFRNVADFLKLLGGRSSKTEAEVIQETVYPSLEEKRNIANGFSKMVSCIFSFLALNQFVGVLYNTVAATQLDKLVTVPLFAILSSINRFFTPDGVSIYQQIFGFTISDGIVTFSLGQGLAIVLGAIFNLVFIWWFCYSLLFLISRLFEPFYSREELKGLKRAKEIIQEIELQKKFKSEVKNQMFEEEIQNDSKP